MLTFLLSLVISLCLAPIIGKTAGLLSVVSKRTTFGQDRSVPLWGGIALIIAFSVALYINNIDLLRDPIIVGSLIFTILGAVDDAIDLKPYLKLILQILCTSCIIIFFYDNQDVFLSLLCICWLILIINAFNFIDSADGLATGYALILFIWFLLIGDRSVYIYALIGLCVGFLPSNGHNAKLYLGDSGSHMLGYCIAILSIPNFHFGYPQGIQWSIVDLLPFVLILCDFSFVVITRSLRGASIMVGGTDHIYHRLTRLIGSVHATISMLLASAFFAFLSILFRELTSELQIIITLILFVFFLTSLFFLARSTNHYFTRSYSR